MYLTEETVRIKTILKRGCKMRTSGPLSHVVTCVTYVTQGKRALNKVLLPESHGVTYVTNVTNCKNRDNWGFIHHRLE